MAGGMMADIYIGRINWFNYNASWNEGVATFDLEALKAIMRKGLEENFQQTYAEKGEMVFNETGDQDAMLIEVGLQNADDLQWLGHAEIFRVPLIGAESDG